VLTRDTWRRITQLFLVRVPHLNSSYFWVPPRIVFQNSQSLNVKTSDTFCYQ